LILLLFSITLLVFLDEVQVLPEFQKAIDALFIKKKCALYITGSNSYLLADFALRSYLLESRYIDRGFILKNIVFLELQRRGYKINIGKSDEYEVDFVAQKNGLTEYFQVCESVRSEETLKRELQAFE